MKKFTIEVEMNERWIPHFMSMLKYMEILGNKGSSRKVGIYSDGDGDFNPKFKTDIEWETKSPVSDNDGNRLYDAGQRLDTYQELCATNERRMIMALPLLISRRKGDIILPTDYKLGWLYKDDKEGYWQVWGSSKDKETALKCVKDVIEKQGKREVFISDEPIPIHLAIEQINSLKKIKV